MEIRLNDDGTLDEIVGWGRFHLEQMDDDQWFLDLGGVRMMLAYNGIDYIKPCIIATPNETNTWKEAQTLANPTQDKE